MQCLARLGGCAGVIGFCELWFPAGPPGNTDGQNNDPGSGPLVQHLPWMTIWFVPVQLSAASAAAAPARRKAAPAASAKAAPLPATPVRLP
jgi:hypothetical protein